MKASLSDTAWLRKPRILARFEIGWRRLEQWRDEGLVRSVKLDTGRAGCRLYCTADIERVLCALAAGRQPRRAAAVGRTA